MNFWLNTSKNFAKGNLLQTWHESGMVGTGKTDSEDPLDCMKPNLSVQGVTGFEGCGFEHLI
jgi:hypothetical protein